MIWFWMILAFVVLYLPALFAVSCIMLGSDETIAEIKRWWADRPRWKDLP